MNTELRTKANNEFEKDYYKLKNNSVYGKTMENIRKHRDIHLVTNDKKRSKLVSEPNYHATKCISKNLLVMEMKKREIYMKKPVYLGQVILDISKTLMYKFWHEYIKPKHADNVKLCYMDTDSFVMHVNTDDFYHDISNDVNLLFDTSNNYIKLLRPLPIGINKKVLGKFKDELGGKRMTVLCALKAKTYAYNLDDDSERKKAKGTKKCIVKRHIIFDNYLDTLFKTTKILKSRYAFKSDHHTLYTQKLNKIALNFFDDKRIQCNDKITTYPYGYFDNTSNINDEIKNNTKELNSIDNSGIIPKNYNTNTPLKNNINNENIINEIIANNADIYSDSANSACTDIIKYTNACVDNTKCTTLVIIKSTNAYTDNIKITIIGIIKSIITFIDNLKIIIAYIIRIIINKANIIYPNNIKSICYAKIRSNNANNNYLVSIKSTCIDKIKSTNVNNNYLDCIKSICHAKIQSNNANNNYLDSIKSTCADKIKTYAIKTNRKNTITIAHKKVSWELNMLLKNKKVTNRRTINTKKINMQAKRIKYELSSLNKL